MAEETKLELVTENADPKELAREKAEEIRRMYEACDEKVVGAKEHLIAQLEVTAEKYLTANGVMQALCTLRDVLGDDSKDMSPDKKMRTARMLARGASKTALNMAARAKDLDPDQLGALCDVFYDADFANRNGGMIEMTEELMALNLCQQVGPNAQDVVDFITSADEEIASARDSLREYCEAEGIDFDEVCGEE